jgi:hypothetical protein
MEPSTRPLGCFAIAIQIATSSVCFGSLADMLNCMKGGPLYPESRHFGAIEIVCYVLEADHPGEARAIRPDQLSKSLPPDRYSFRGRLPGAWFLERV